MSGVQVLPSGCSIPITGETGAGHYIILDGTELCGRLPIPTPMLVFNSGVDQNPLTVNRGIDFIPITNATSTFPIAGDDWQRGNFQINQPFFEENTVGAPIVIEDFNDAGPIDTSIMKMFPEGDYIMTARWQKRSTSFLIGDVDASMDFNMLGFTADDRTTGVLLGVTQTVTKTFLNNSTISTGASTLTGEPWDIQIPFTVPAGMAGITFGATNLIYNGTPEQGQSDVGIDDVIIWKV